MKKFILALALLVTASNLAVGVVYASVCSGTNGGRACGTDCTSMADGKCVCQGACTADELKWVDGAGPKAAAMAEEAAY